MQKTNVNPYKIGEAIVFANGTRRGCIESTGNPYKIKFIDDDGYVSSIDLGAGQFTKDEDAHIGCVLIKYEQDDQLLFLPIPNSQISPSNKPTD